MRCPNCETAVHVPELELEANAEPEEYDEAEEVEVLEVEPVAVEQPVLMPPTSSSPPEGAIGTQSLPQVDDEDEDDEVLPRNPRP